MLIVGTIVILTIPVLAQEISEVTIAWEDGLKPPYLMLDDRKQPTGIAVDILNKIFSRQEIKVSHLILPWKRCLALIKNKKIDIVPNSSYKEERTLFAYYTKPMYETHLVLFYKKAQFSTVPTFAKIDDLEPYKIGGVLGFNYTWYEGKINLDTGAKTREILIIKLRNGRVDFAILQKEVLLALQHEGKVNLTGLGSIPDPIRPTKVYYVLTVKNERGKKLQKIINHGIDQLSQDGIIIKIMQQYLSSEYK